MTLQEQKTCPMISSKATVASWNSLHWSCKPLIRLRKILASRSLEKGGRRALARRVGIARPCVDPHPPRPANGRLGDLPFSRGGMEQVASPHHAERGGARGTAFAILLVRAHAVSRNPRRARRGSTSAQKYGSSSR